MVHIGIAVLSLAATKNAETETIAVLRMAIIGSTVGTLLTYRATVMATKRFVESERLLNNRV